MIYLLTATGFDTRWQ